MGYSFRSLALVFLGFVFLSPPSFADPLSPSVFRKVTPTTQTGVTPTLSGTVATPEAVPTLSMKFDACVEVTHYKVKSEVPDHCVVQVKVLQMLTTSSSDPLIISRGTPEQFIMEAPMCDDFREAAFAKAPIHVSGKIGLSRYYQDPENSLDSMAYEPLCTTE